MLVCYYLDPTPLSRIESQVNCLPASPPFDHEYRCLPPALSPFHALVVLPGDVTVLRLDAQNIRQNRTIMALLFTLLSNAMVSIILGQTASSSCYPARQDDTPVSARNDIPAQQREARHASGWRRVSNCSQPPLKFKAINPTTPIRFIMNKVK